MIWAPTSREKDYMAWTRERDREIRNICGMLALPYIDSGSGSAARELTPASESELRPAQIAITQEWHDRREWPPAPWMTDDPEGPDAKRALAPKPQASPAPLAASFATLGGWIARHAPGHRGGTHTRNRHVACFVVFE